MRKHFLLFLLTVLLPLAGWAEDLSSASVAVGNIVKGTEATGVPFVVWEGETLTQGIHYTVEGVYTKNGNDYAAIEGALSAQPVGTYYVKISGKPENGFNGVAYGAFEITKKPLTIDFTGVAATYGDNPTAVTYKVYDGGTWLNPDDENEEKAAAATAIITGLGIQAKTKSGANVITIGKTTPVGNYDFDFTYTTTGDYTLTRKESDADQYVISAKSITADGMTVTMATPGTYNYTGNAITGLPTFTVKDGTTNVETFNVKWFAAALVPETSDDAAVNPTNAGTYYARVTGTGNYAGKVFDNDNWKITVNKVPLTVLVNPKSKTYDGQNYTTANVEYTFGGLVDADQGKVNLNSLTTKVDGNDWGVGFKDYKEGGYVISVVTGDATIGDPAIALSTNYIVTPVSSTWTINKISGLTITAANQQINFDGAIPGTSDITATGALEAEKAAIEALYVAPKAAAAVNNAYGVQPNIYTPALIEVGEGGYPNPETKAAAEAVLANYAIPYTIVNGSLSVGAANATIMPIVASAFYDGKGHLATGYSATSGEYVLTADDIEGTPSYKYKKQNPETLAWSEWDENLVPTAVGVYRAVVKSTSVSGKGSFANAVFNKPEVQFEIQAKPITVTVDEVTLHKGDTETTLNAHAKVTDTYKDNLVSGETLEFTFKFDPDKVGADKVVKVEEGTGKISEGDAYDPEVVNNAIIAELKDGGAYNDNYNITFVPGNLIFGASELVLDPTDATLATKISEAAATGEKYDVTFAHLTMKANEWYAMVLPFEVDPKEMVYAADRYVIFNELNVAGTTAGNFKFTLKFEPIPAGTPFLIKFAGGADDIIDWAADIDPDMEGIQSIAFNGVDISAAINATEKEGILTFTGTYASDVELQGSRTNGSENYVWWLCDTRYERSTRVNDWLKPISKPHTVAPMEAWLDGNESAWTGYAPIITVEDFDGQTTSIQTLNAGEINGLNVVNEGWYTINGIKLDAKPTEKGIYIFNGKKVAIQ